MSMDPEQYYNQIGMEEWNRSDEKFLNSLEHRNTLPYMEKYLPEKGRVLDAGGASGKYAVWLAEKGYDVTLVDISEEQLDIAEEKLEERGLLDKVDIKKGDIRDLEFEDETFDAVLCLGGPLSHVIDGKERESAAKELVRVAKQDSPVFVSVMGFYAMILAGVLEEWGVIWDIEDFSDRQKYDKKHIERTDEEPVFAHTYFFKKKQLENLLKNQGLNIEEIVGLENVASVIRVKRDDEKDLDVPEGYKEKLRKASQIFREDEAAPDLSLHLLAVGFK